MIGNLNGDATIGGHNAALNAWTRLSLGGSVKIPWLGGSGSQMVITDNDGLLSKRAIPIPIANTDNQTLSISGQTLSISGMAGSSVTLPPNTDNQTLSISGQTLSISGMAGSSVTLPPNTDNQNLSISGNSLSISGGTGVILPTVGWVDNRAASPSDFSAQKLHYGFGTYGNNNAAPFADILVMRGWQDASGGNDNMVAFNKNGIGMRIYQQAYGSSSNFSTYKEAVLADPSGNVQIAGLSGSGNQMVVADNSGNLSKQAIPVDTDNQNLTLSGQTLSISGGTGVTLPWNKTGANISYTTGNVGIGTANPSVLFEVIEDIIVTGSAADQTGSGTASASSGNGFLAFDNTNNLWFTDDGVTTGWLAYDFGAANKKIITQYKMVIPNIFQIGPKNWTFEGSNDNSSWTILDTRINQIQTPANTTFWSFDIPNTTAYRYYRINISANNGSPNFISIREVELIAGDYVLSKEGLRVNNGMVTVSGAYTLPAVDGLSNQVMTTDGSGHLSWISQTADNDNQTLSISGQTLSISGAAGSSVTLPAAHWNKSGSNLSYSTGNVGIGTVAATSNSKLKINSDASGWIAGNFGDNTAGNRPGRDG